MHTVVGYVYIMSPIDTFTGLDRTGSGWGRVAGTCECGNEPSSSMKCGAFLDYLKTGYFLKKDSAPWIR